MRTDRELLQEFVHQDSEQAFRELVDLHAAMVNGVARRAVRDARLANDITQVVFMVLARKAAVLARTTVLGGWLHRTTRFVAMETIRAERRRQHHQGEAARGGAAIQAEALPGVLSICPAGRVSSDLSARILSAGLSRTGGGDPSTAALTERVSKLMTLHQLKTTALLGILALCLVAGAVRIGGEALRHAAPPVTPVRSLEPMAGDWTGTYTRSGDAAPGASQTTTLNVVNRDAGRTCSITMRVPDPAGATTMEYRFTHTLDPAGTSVTTQDDPRIAWMTGTGRVTESVHDPKSKDWIVAFQTTRANDGGSSECRWQRNGDALIIVRRDRIPTPQGTREFVSELRLHRVAPGKPSS
jgi:hypothetical protein